MMCLTFLFFVNFVKKRAQIKRNYREIKVPTPSYLSMTKMFELIAENHNMTTTNTIITTYDHIITLIVVLIIETL